MAKSKPVKRVKAGTGKAAAAARRVAFAHEYIANGGNAAQAAIVAGFAKGSARVTGSQLLTDPNVQAIIGEATKKAIAISGLTVERTLLEIARLAYADPRKLRRPDGSFIPFHEMDDDTAATVAGVEFDEIKAGEAGVIGQTVKIKVWDKNAALEKAMKFHGLYERDNEQSKPLTQVAIIQLVPLTPLAPRGEA